jgi:hypothetical protein
VVLFDMKKNIFAPHLAAIDRIIDSPHVSPARRRGRLVRSEPLVHRAGRQAGVRGQTDKCAPSNRKGDCGTTPMAWRSRGSGTSRTSRPSTSTAPALTSVSRSSSASRLLFPAPGADGLFYFFLFF